MKRIRPWAVLVLAALAVAFFGASALASPITVVEGSPVVFGGAAFRRQDDHLKVSLDWVGLAADFDWNGVMFRVGGAANPNLGSIPTDAAGYTFGFGAETARIFSMMAAVEGSAIAFVQDTGAGCNLALAGRCTGATARIGVNTNFGMVPEGFHTTPARLIGQDFWTEEPGRDVTGKSWIDLTATLQSFRTRADSIRLGYMRELGQGNEENWRGDVAYIGKYRPEDSGLSINLNTGIAFGNQAFVLINKLGIRADVTDRSGAEISVVGQSGGGADYAWISGSAWLSLGEKGDVKFSVSAPVLGDGAYEGPELFRPIDAAALCLSLDLAKGVLSQVATRYDLRTKAIGLEVSSRF